MRLSKIKLAGFKSFVDPTTVLLPNNLTGVVGPNGCGKSNVIDAVRWVMGELSAKHLRGDSMADVIFNGSNSRKPVGAASVELIFDNSDGKIGGAYAAYSEVSLKRLVSRDGSSSYFINGGRCRRKDITQLFLGTGLGSRSYAIIEQGMISRVIDARPEELRAFLEEAAGISLYKERRRETEARVADTRENLARLQDLRDEVDKQIRHLQRQANAARRYQDLRGRERVLQAEVLALKLRDLDSGVEVQDEAMRAGDLAMQRSLAEQRAAEAAMEKQREYCAELTLKQSQVQGRYYELGAEVTRGEEQIRYRKELRERAQQDAAQTATALHSLDAQLSGDLARSAEVSAELAELEPAAAQQQQLEHTAAELLAEHERTLTEWQSRWELHNQSWGAASQSVQVECARIEQLESQRLLLQTQGDRLAIEQEDLSRAQLEQPLQALGVEESAARSASDALDVELTAVIDSLQQGRAAVREHEQRLTAERVKREQQRSELLSVEALQQAAMGGDDAPDPRWWRESGMGTRPRLAATLQVTSGWERAVETALGDYLEAACVDGLEELETPLGTMTHGRVGFVVRGEGEISDPTGTLASMVRGPLAARRMLAGIHTAASLGEALRRRHGLAAGESIMTASGEWVGADWLRVNRRSAGASGVLEREQRLQQLRDGAAERDTACQQAEQRLQEMRGELDGQERALQSLQQRAQQAHRDHGALNARLDGLRQRHEEALQRGARMEQERLGVVSESARIAAQLATARSAHDLALRELQVLDGRRPELEEERELLHDRCAQARKAAQGAQLAAREALIKLESRRTSLSSMQQAATRMRAQRAELGERAAQLALALETADQPLAELEQQLQHNLARRLEAETELAGARRMLEDAERSFAELEQRRMAAQQKVDAARVELEQARMQAQESRLRRESLLEQFAQTQCELSIISAGLAADAAIEPWEARLAETRADIDKLGSVNLAAIDELKEQSERKQYLDSQYNDVSDALTTLEEAMRKIERETRARFNDTFERVNAGLKEKFPRLFGGGHAYLELDQGADALNGGVTIMARPPGKRNSTISQLSGGEKALTAVALVFSIFDLNPAPFCLLDEVDAPLDEHNVGRFCDIVRDMSSRVQFIFITHNKATMELASRLIGVTMHEPGVSRLVSVDVDEAVRLAAV